MRDFKGLGRLCARWEGGRPARTRTVSRRRPAGCLRMLIGSRGPRGVVFGGPWLRHGQVGEEEAYEQSTRPSRSSSFSFFSLFPSSSASSSSGRTTPWALRVLARRRATLVVASLGTHTAFRRRRRRRSEKKKREEARRSKKKVLSAVLRNPTSCQLQL